jgi:hypothetical protein
MDLEVLEREYTIAKETNNFSKHQQFIKQLLSSNEPPIVDYHYRLLTKRDNRDLCLRLRAAFKKRGVVAEGFLIDRFKVEQDPKLQGDILHLLGGLRSKEARPIALEFLAHQDQEHRNIGCYVLGWVGTKDDIALLGERLLHDPDAPVRETAATAHDQIMIRLPDTKTKLLSNLKTALEKEKNEEVMAWIIITIQYILKKKFGLKENIEEAEWSGDVSQAKIKALKVLESIK